MDRFSVWSALLVGMFMAGVSSQAIAASDKGGQGGYSGQRGQGGHAAQGGGYRGQRGYAIPGGSYRGQGGHTSYRTYPAYRPHPSYRGYPGYHPHRGYPGYHPHRGYRGYDSWGVSIVIDPFFYGYYPGPYYYPPSYYAPPYYYPPAVVPVPSSPPVYIERGESAEPVPQDSAYWYYCSDPQGYYPDVGQCPGGWQAVPPRPPAASDEAR